MLEAAGADGELGEFEATTVDVAITTFADEDAEPAESVTATVVVDNTVAVEVIDAAAVAVFMLLREVSFSRGGQEGTLA